MTPRVSVILPAYNRAQLLPRAIGSVLAQTHADFELIVVDDGSTDNTEAVVRRLADPRIRYLRRRNGGPGAARNTGIATARGEFVAFQDSDDEWLPHKLERQLARFGRSAGGVGLVVCGHRETRVDAITELCVDDHLARGEAPASLLTGLWYVPATWLVRRDVLARAGSFDESLPSCEDWDLAFRLSDKCRFDFVPEVLVLKHHSPGSVFDHPPRRIAGFRRILRRHRRRWRAAPAVLARQEYVVGYWLLREQRRPLSAWWYLLRASWRDPAGQGPAVRELLRAELAPRLAPLRALAHRIGFHRIFRPRHR
jgi:glycosyltransferase involved in cell wall biosynthesis